MKIKMASGDSSIEWTLYRNGKAAYVRQVDKLGTHRLDFDSAHLAGTWIWAQVAWVSAEMPEYRFTYPS